MAVLLSVWITLQDLIDSDELLDPEDLKKPDPASLKAPSCGEGKKRKACKNCTCGLAEELEKEQSKAQSSQPKSACGNVRTTPPRTHQPLLLRTTLTAQSS